MPQLNYPLLSLASCCIVPGKQCSCPWPAVFLSLVICVCVPGHLSYCPWPAVLLALATCILVLGHLSYCPWPTVLLALATCILVPGQLSFNPRPAVFLCPWPTVFFSCYPWPSFVLAASLAKLGPRWRAGNIHSWNTRLQVITGGGQATGNAWNTYQTAWRSQCTLPK